MSTDPCPSWPFQDLCGIKIETGLSGLVLIFLIFATIASVLFIVYGGYKWMSSNGDKAAIDSARSMIIAAVFGLLFTFMSFFILNWIFISLFNIKPTDNLWIPSIPFTNTRP